MRRVMLAALLLIAGCQNVVGPFQARRPQRVDDPCLPIAEQERRGRDRLALPVQGTMEAPPVFPERAGPLARGYYPGN